jgi:deoxyxylulose-5-phosphate synthase
MSIAANISEISGNCRVESLGVPTKFLPHAKPDRLLAQLGLDADGIIKAYDSASL